MWGWTLLLSSLFNAAACWSAAWWMARAHWVGHTAYGIYLVLELLPAAIFLTGMLWMARRRRQILAADPVPLVVDDDVYWRKGWYENPNDPRWLVQDRLVPYNYSMNMAKPGAWGGTIALLAGGGDPPGGGLCVLFLWADFGGSSVSITSGRVAVSAFLYDTEVAPKTSGPSPFWRPCRRMNTSAPTAWTTAAASSATSAVGRPAPVRCTSTPTPPPSWRWETGRAPSISTARTPAQTQTWYADLLAVTAGMLSVRCVLAPDLLHLSLDALLWTARII